MQIDNYLFKFACSQPITMRYFLSHLTIVKTTIDDFVWRLKVKLANISVLGIPLPEYWDPMPNANVTVYTVELSPSSFEYQAVLFRFQATVNGVTIHKIERIQNPHLYQCYMVRKQKMDKDLGRNSERQLFHGTNASNISHINTQGFNRSLCGAHGRSCYLSYCSE